MKLHEMTIDEWWNRLGLRSSSYDLTSRLFFLKWTVRQKSSRHAEYLKSKIRIPNSKICFFKFLSRSDWTLAAGGSADT